MRTNEILRAWGIILAGRAPSLSIEITRECPLRCPGCYAYNDDHLGTGVNLRQLDDYRGPELVAGVLKLVDEEKPLHLSIVGGDPMVRLKELEELLPILTGKGIHCQIVTSAYRKIPAHWRENPRVSVVVSIDGLQPEHDVRRKPATYERILKNIAEASVTVHCTVTSQMAGRPGYLAEFLEFWTARPEIKRVWVSLYTPQRGEVSEERLSASDRASVLSDLVVLQDHFDKLEMPKALIEALASPPSSPEDCIFARTTRTVSADLKTMITPCQFGGSPDCTQCGCVASAALHAVGRHRLAGGLRVGAIYNGSVRIGSAMRRLSAAASQ